MIAATSPRNTAPAWSLERGVAELEAAGAPVSILTLPIPPRRSARASVPLGLGAILQWDDPAPDADGRVWSFAAAGEAALVEGAGDARLEQVADAARALFGSAASATHPDAAFAPNVRLFGGIAFRPEPTRAGPWARFRDASFVLPRWLVGTSHDRAFVRVAWRAGESLDRESFARVMERVMERPTRPEDPSEVPPKAPRVDATSFDQWSQMVGNALARIRSAELEKVVPATVYKVSTASTLDVAGALERLASLYPDCARFAFQRGDSVFVGASPERLLAKRGRSVMSDALAGSTPRPADASAEDDANACARLLASNKDRREHQAVIDAIASALRVHGAELTVPEVPRPRTLRNVHHLWTPIRATLSRPTHVLDLVRSLHPTPAVCGTPRAPAIAWIAEHEPDTRGWYAGAVGWFDAEGDGSFSVAIRSGVIAPHEAWLYAGAGIVEGSDPTLEFAETRAKRAPMLAALGLPR